MDKQIAKLLEDSEKDETLFNARVAAHEAWRNWCRSQDELEEALNAHAEANGINEDDKSMLSQEIEEILQQ